MLMLRLWWSALQVAAPGRRPGQWGAARSITDAEHCLWLGDLNYRYGDCTDCSTVVTSCAPGCTLPDGYCGFIDVML
jgi:hypothetical protein